MLHDDVVVFLSQCAAWSRIASTLGIDIGMQHPKLLWTVTRKPGDIDSGLHHGARHCDRMVRTTTRLKG